MCHLWEALLQTVCVLRSMLQCDFTVTYAVFSYNLYRYSVAYPEASTFPVNGEKIRIAVPIGTTILTSLTDVCF